ncbi:MAG UNVERIFIED_CONTAM: hypothetical protein LVR18_43565 [Planctomycetaceae bacterium]|jgi:transcriptional accessory protein Tex/SPT6
MKDDLFLMDRFLQETSVRLQVRAEQVDGAVRLLEDGNTIPFIALPTRSHSRTR